VRGPVVPVCQVNVSCNAPFSATFTIERSGKLVAQFRSGNDGSFTVWLDPGDYRVTPAADAPLIAPGSQTRQVEVGTTGLTTVRLEFDTGIR